MKPDVFTRLSKSRAFIGDFISNPERAIINYGIVFDNEDALTAYFKKSDQLFETIIESTKGIPWWLGMLECSFLDCSINNCNNGIVKPALGGNIKIKTTAGK